jgi:hypothetical protein
VHGEMARVPRIAAADMTHARPQDNESPAAGSESMMR